MIVDSDTLLQNAYNSVRVITYYREETSDMLSLMENLSPFQ